MGGRGGAKRRQVGRTGAGASHGGTRRPQDWRRRRGQRGGARGQVGRLTCGRGGAACHVSPRGEGQHVRGVRWKRRGWCRPGGACVRAEQKISDSRQCRRILPPGTQGVNPRGQSGRGDDRGPPTNAQAALRQGEGGASEQGVHVRGGVSGVRQEAPEGPLRRAVHSAGQSTAPHQREGPQPVVRLRARAQAKQ